MHGEGDLMRGDGIEAQLLREELSDEAVHVLVGAALPGSIRMCEVEVGIECPGNAFMSCELAAVVGRQCVNASLDRFEHRDHGVGDDLGGFIRDVGDQSIARLAFVDRNKCLPMGGADDQIGLPVAEATARIDDGRALLDRHLIRMVPRRSCPP